MICIIYSLGTIEKTGVREDPIKNDIDKKTLLVGALVTILVTVMLRI